MNYTIVKDDVGSTITVYGLGDGPLVANNSSNPNFDEIIISLLDYDERCQDDEEILALFDYHLPFNNYFESLSERISARNGTVHIDGDPVDNALTNHIIRFLEEGSDKWIGLVNFYENTLTNPNDHSREQLYNWLDKKEFTITIDGMIVGYKGVYSDKEHEYVSTSSGDAIVDGTPYHGRIPNWEGAIVEMPRSEVQHNPSRGCSVGLHVGTYDFAKTYGNTLLEVYINPRDVVSVPTDSNWAKMRCCRYQVVGPIEERYEQTVIEPIHVEVVHPTPKAWTDLVDKAKSQRKGIDKLAHKKGWVLFGSFEDRKERKSWIIPVKEYSPDA